MPTEVALESALRLKSRASEGNSGERCRSLARSRIGGARTRAHAALAAFRKAERTGRRDDPPASTPKCPLDPGTLRRHQDLLPGLSLRHRALPHHRETLSRIDS